MHAWPARRRIDSGRFAGKVARIEPKPFVDLATAAPAKASDGPRTRDAAVR